MPLQVFATFLPSWYYLFVKCGTCNDIYTLHTFLLLHLEELLTAEIYAIIQLMRQ